MTKAQMLVAHTEEVATLRNKLKVAQDLSINGVKNQRALTQELSLVQQDFLDTRIELSDQLADAETKLINRKRLYLDLLSQINKFKSKNIFKKAFYKFYV
jgi:hypothetical protein